MSNQQPEKMPPNGSLEITRLAAGTAARIVEVRGDRATVDKLAALGILPGMTVTKKSSSPMKGPIVVQKGAVQVALGYSLAKKILVMPIINKQNDRSTV